MMEVSLGSTLLAGDPRLVDHIVGEVKSQGIFDQFRKECIADVDTKPAYQNLRTRVESSVNTFLCKQIWKPDMNKNQLRENLRKQIHDAAYLDAGVERIVDQVVNPKVYSVFMPQIEDVVYKFLGIERPKDRERNGTKSLKDLLPKDLDPVSPESDKNSLKDVSLESVDANMAATSGENDHSLSKDASKIETNFQSEENVNDKLVSDTNSPNKLSDNSESQLESNPKNSMKNLPASNLNISTRSDEKTEEEEEDSPMFEPIDIMNFNESNDSHLSGISELTSHRSRSPDFSNDFSRDNLDFSNHDSQLSKVSSDSRLSIVTDFGLSNHGSTPMPETFKEDSNKGKSVESSEPKCNKDNFKEIRDIETNKLTTKETKNSFDSIRSKENAQEAKDSKDSKSTKGTPDSTDSGAKEKNDSKDSKDKSKENDGIKTKSNKEKGDLKESKTHKEREKDHKKRQSSHSSSKHDKSDKIDKYQKDKYKDKSEKCRENTEKCKHHLDKSKESEKPKEDKKDVDKKESAAKDLKDIYKEKIRELREKKELTEKEKLTKDPKDSKSTKESKDKKDSSRDRRDSKSSSSKSSSRHDDKSNKNDEKSVSKNDSKSSGKAVDLKESRSESKDKGKRDEKRQSKDSKESRSKSHGNSKSDPIDKSEKYENKRDVKNDVKSESQRPETKKDAKTESHNKDHERAEKLDAKKDSKTDSQNKERKRKDDKKTKMKDDHSSLRKNPNDRRSTDRDGSNGSNSKNSQKSSSSSIANSSKTGSTSLTKESSGTSNSSSETSDNVSPADGIKLPIESIHADKEDSSKVRPFTIKITNKNESEPDYYIESDLTPKRVDLGQAELSLPLKKRPLQADTAAPNPNDFKVKKPKFAKNFREAKKLMKIRKKLEKQRLEEYEAAKEKFQMANDSNKPESPLAQAVTDKNSPILPDDERVQIIEVTDDEYEEPYPDLSMKEINISLERQSLTSLENPLVFNPEEKLQNIAEKQSNLSAMEKSIRQSLQDMMSDKKLVESGTPAEDANDSAASVKTLQSKAFVSKNNEKQFIADSHPEKGNSVENNEADKLDKSTTCKEKSDVRHLNLTISSGPTISPCSNKSETSASESDDSCNCLYFEADNERALKFSKFVQTLELEVLEDETCPQSSTESLEKILESLGGQIVRALPKTMAPPMPKRKHSTSPLMDILLNSTNNNNNRHKMKESTPEEESNIMKRKKLGRPKKLRAVANVCGIQNLPNGENFVMPLSPESDVSASSEKNSLLLPKEDKSRQRSSQRYSSDDLYKPRPFFSSSSRRSRRSNQA